MLTIFSFVYGPLIVWLTETFSSKISSFVILFSSLVLIALNFKEKNRAFIVPFAYLIVSIATLICEKPVFLKFVPITISFGVAVILSERKGVSEAIQNFFNRWKFLREKNISLERIGSNVWIWASAAWLNVFLHAVVLIFASEWIWAFYVSVGWYLVFALAIAVNIYSWRKIGANKIE